MSNGLEPTELIELVGQHIQIQTAVCRMSGVLSAVARRGDGWWLDLADGQSLRYEEGVTVAADPILGTFDFAETPQERFPHIYAAYDNYDTAPVRRFNRCQCKSCQTAVVGPPTGLGPDAVPVDDVWPKDEKGREWSW